MRNLYSDHCTIHFHTTKYKSFNIILLPEYNSPDQLIIVYVYDSVTINKQTNQTIATLFTCNLYESADVRVFKPSLDCKALFGVPELFLSLFVFSHQGVTTRTRIILNLELRME